MSLRRYAIYHVMVLICVISHEYMPLRLVDAYPNANSNKCWREKGH